MFWIPRSFPDMPAFTTNVEFGEWYKEDKTFYGRPNNSRKNRYLDKKYLLYTKRLPYSSLENLRKASVDKLNGEYIDLRASTEYCILEYIMNKYVEIYYLVGNSKLVLTEYDSINENISYGKIFFPNKSEEDLKVFNKTMLSIVSYYLLKFGYYNSFTACQKSEDKLTLNDFNELRKYIFSVINTNEKENLILYYIVLNSLSRTKIVNKVFEEMGFDNNIDSNTAFKIIIKQNKLLCDLDKDMLRNIIENRIDVIDFSKKECVKFSQEYISKLSKFEFDFMIVEAMLEFAGKKGNITQNGSMSLNHFAYINFKSAVRKLFNLYGVND